MANVTMSPEEQMEAMARAIYTGSPGEKLAPYFFGLFFDTLLAGVSIQQFSHYMTYSRDERRFVKYIVYFSCLANLGFTAFNLALMLNDFVYHTGTYSVFIGVDWFSYYPLLDVAATVFVQIFYIDRAWRLNNRSFIVPVLTIPLICTIFACAVGIKVEMVLLTDISEAHAVNVWFYIWLGAAAALDIVTMCFIAFGLWKSKTGWSSTDRLVKRLILLGCETQLPPSIFAACLLAQFSVDPTASMDIFWMMIHPKIYLVGLFVVLNSRYNLRRDLESGDGGSKNALGKSHNTFAGTNRLQQATVHVHTEQYIESHQLESTKYRPNRDPLPEDKEDGSEDSVNLDYRYNTSKIGLNEPSSRI